MIRLCVQVIVRPGEIRQYLTKPSEAHNVCRRIKSYDLAAEITGAPALWSELEGWSSDQILQELKPFIEEREEQWWDK